MCTTKKLTSWKSLKKGQKFIVRSNSNSHSYPIGTILTMRKNGECDDTMNNVAVELCGNSLDICDIELVNNTLEVLKARLATLESEKAVVVGKIKFCEDNGTTEFDETEYEIFAALDILEGTGSRKEKAAMLAKILNKK